MGETERDAGAFIYNYALWSRIPQNRADAERHTAARWYPRPGHRALNGPMRFMHHGGLAHAGMVMRHAHGDGTSAWPHICEGRRARCYLLASEEPYKI